MKINERNQKSEYEEPFFFETSRVTLGESHDEDEIDGNESEKVAHNHPVNHYDERSDRLEASAEEQKIWCRRQHHYDRQHVFDLIGAGKS